MKRFTPILCLSILCIFALSACDTDFQNNPHGTSYVDALTPQASVPTVPATTKVATDQHLSPFGFGASLQAIVAQYGQPTKYTVPPLYAFQDGSAVWPSGSLIIVTMKENRAIEFSYVPGSDHPMTYQEAQDFAVKLLPDDAQGPKTVQKEDDHNGKCLAKTYHSELLKKIFPSNDFISVDGKDSDLGSVTVNFYPDSLVSSGVTSVDSTPEGEYELAGGANEVVNNQVNSVLINLGSRPSC